MAPITGNPRAGTVGYDDNSQTRSCASGHLRRTSWFLLFPSTKYNSKQNPARPSSNGPLHANLFWAVHPSHAFLLLCLATTALKYHLFFLSSTLPASPTTTFFPSRHITTLLSISPQFVSNLIPQSSGLLRGCLPKSSHHHLPCRVASHSILHTAQTRHCQLSSVT